MVSQTVHIGDEGKTGLRTLTQAQKFVDRQLSIWMGPVTVIWSQ